MPEARARLRIYGRVQGVFYRGETVEEAYKLNLKGWVANKRDSSVEVVVEGPRRDIEKLIQWCHKGPRLARVERVDVQWEEPTGEFDDFRVRYAF